MKILLIGASGQVGLALQRQLSASPQHTLTCPTRTEFDLTSASQMRQVIRQVAPQLLINCAAYTAVDRAESEPALAAAINGAAPGVMAQEMQRLGGAMIQYSTDYVFDGKKEGRYQEDDTPAPLSVYGATKLAGEEAVTQQCDAALVMRLSWVYGTDGGNFLKTILRLARERERLEIVDDQYGAPTWSERIAAHTAAVIDAAAGNPEVFLQRRGCYHLTAGGATSWHDYARLLLREAAQYDSTPLADIVAIPSSQRPSPAARPANSRLDCSKFVAAFGSPQTPWEEDVAACVRKLLQSDQVRAIKP